MYKYSIIFHPAVKCQNDNTAAIIDLHVIAYNNI